MLCCYYCAVRASDAFPQATYVCNLLPPEQKIPAPLATPIAPPAAAVVGVPTAAANTDGASPTTDLPLVHSVVRAMSRSALLLFALTVIESPQPVAIIVSVAILLLVAAIVVFIYVRFLRKKPEEYEIVMQ